MKKITMILMLIFLLIGVNVYAAGDLVVNGQLGLGSISTSAKLAIEGNDIRALETNSTKTGTAYLDGLSLITSDSYSGSGASSLSRGLLISSDHIGTPTGTHNGTAGANYLLRFYGSGNISQAYAQKNQIVLRSDNNYAITNLFGNMVSLNTGGTHSGDHTVTNYYGYYSFGSSLTQTISGTDWRHAYYVDFPDFGGTVANVTGLWIDKQTLGETSNFGIVLNGDGSFTSGNEIDYGAAIVFGTGQCCKIFSQSGVLKASDAAGYVTQFSPHDPETGEWIFYSQNVKTGKTVRVNMEKLVKAVEKLTGETFMVETLMEK